MDDNNEVRLDDVVVRQPQSPIIGPLITEVGSLPIEPQDTWALCALCCFCCEPELCNECCNLCCGGCQGGCRMYLGFLRVTMSDHDAQKHKDDVITNQPAKQEQKNSGLGDALTEAAEDGCAACCCLTFCCCFQEECWNCCSE
uniref:Uncharacterized protein n=1 Tax=Strigamia maritima TaxID=126957 RepID=T1JEP2_STRMM